MDTETTPGLAVKGRADRPHTLRLWCATHIRLTGGKIRSRADYDGTTAAGWWELVARLSDRRRPLWVWAHNLSFDLIALGIGQAMIDGPLRIWCGADEGPIFREAAALAGWSGLVVLNDPPSVIETRHESTGASVVFLDTMNWWRCSLEKLGELVDLPKIKMPSFRASDADWLTYCRRDVAIVKDTVLRTIALVRDNDLGQMRYTAPAQGLQAFRHRFMTHKILVHCDAPSLKLERDAYFGGLCQLRYRGKVRGPIYVLDCTAFYPSVMADTTQPCRWLGHAAEPAPELVTRLLAWSWVVARVDLPDGGWSVPCRSGQATGLTRRPCQTVLHWPELMALRESGVRHAVRELAWYQAEPLFAAYVTELFALRSKYVANAANVEADLVKLLMNGLVGKLGQKQATWIDRPDLIHDAPWGTWRQGDARLGHCTNFRCLAGRVQQERAGGEPAQAAFMTETEQNELKGPLADESPSSCPSIAGAITSWGRARLAEWIALAGPRSVYYVDTDCLHTDQAGLDRLTAAGQVAPHTIGKLGLKGVHNRAEYLAPKIYSLDGKWTAAGLKKSATPTGAYQWSQTDFSGWSLLISGAEDCGPWETTHGVDLAQLRDPARCGPGGWIDEVIGERNGS